MKQEDPLPKDDDAIVFLLEWTMAVGQVQEGETEKACLPLTMGGIAFTSAGFQHWQPLKLD